MKHGLLYGLLVCSLTTLVACGCSSKNPPAAVTKTSEQIPAQVGVLAKGPSSALSPETVASYFTAGPAANAARLYDLEQFAEARAEFRKALAEEKNPDQRSRLQLMDAVCSLWLRDWAPAAEGLDRARDHHPLLGDWLLLQSAVAHRALGHSDKALSLAQRVSADSVQGREAQLLLGELLREGDDHQATASLYRQYLERKGGIRRAEARYQLADALAHQGKAVEAAEQWRYLVVHAPLSNWAQKAQEQLDERIPRLPAPARKRLQTWSSQERAARAMAYYDQNRNDLAAAEFAMAETLPMTDKQRCSVLYHHGNAYWKLRNRTQGAPILVRALEACKQAGDAELQVKSAYQLARSYDKLDEEQKAIEAFEYIETHHPKHSYADDARLHIAESYEELGETAKMRQVLASIPDVYPDGDQKPVALWRLAWSHYKEGNYPKAIAWLERQIEAEPVPDSWERAGQAHYWLARCYGHLGKGERSATLYRQVVETFPLSYYSLLSLNRLRESHPAVHKQVMAAIVVPPSDPAEGSLVFSERPEFQDPRFVRAVEMLRLGLSQAATGELQRLGFRSPPGKDRLSDADEIEKTWAYAFLFHYAGSYSRSHWVTRWHVLDYKRHWPEGAWRNRWEIAYPKAHWPLIQRFAKMRGYPPELLIAFIREESSFDPLLESWANAIGLTQMIIPTAERFAKGTGIAPTRESLRDPEKNVTIGSNFLKFLYEKWQGQISLLVPSYNTGENRVARWLSEKPDMARDEFSEDIPYDEPQRYNKRVTESFFIYSYLKDRTVPSLPN